MGILSRTRDNKKKSGFLDKLRGKVKTGMESAQKSGQERRIRRDEINLIRKDEKFKQEKKHARFTVQEEYRQKRKGIRSGGGRGGGFSLDGLILGNTGGGRGGGDPMSDLILGKTTKPKTKRKKKKKKTQPQVIVVIQEPKKRRRRKRKK